MSNTSMNKKAEKAPKETKALEKREEKAHKDFDHDGERGEPAKHVEKVLGVGKKKADMISREKPKTSKMPEKKAKTKKAK